MAQKFNNGDSFATVREILNTNAEEINTNKVIAERLANGDTDGRVLSSTISALGLNPSSIETTGVMTYKNGKGVPMAVLLAKNTNLQTAAESADKGVLWILSGTYRGAWKSASSNINALAFIAGGKIIAFDFGTGEVWMLNGTQWVQASGSGSGGEGGGQSVITLDGETVQEQDLDVVLAVKAGQVVTYILPLGQYTGAWYDMQYPFVNTQLGPTEAVVTVYPNGMKTAIVSGFGDSAEPGEDEREVFNGTMTYTPATGWALAYNWPQHVAGNPLPGKEDKDGNGK